MQEKINRIIKLSDDSFDFKDHKTNLKNIHKIHPYPAVMIYPIAKKILEIINDEGTVQKMIDPFSGSGTNLIESVVSGIPNVSGNDLNPLSKIITQARLKPLGNFEKSNLKLLSKEIKLKSEDWKLFAESFHSDVLKTKGDIFGKNGWLEKEGKFNKILFDNFDQNYIRNLGYWFKPNILIELLFIKKEAKIKKVFESDIFKATFSEIARKASNQRNGEHKLYRIKKEKLKDHNFDVLGHFMQLLEKNIIRKERFQEQTNGSYIFDFSEDDVRNLSAKDEQFDLVLTSPPYGDSQTTVAYGQFSRLSLELLEVPEPNVDKFLLGGSKNRKDYYFSSSYSGILNDTLNKIKSKNQKRAKEVELFFDDFFESFCEIERITKTGGIQVWVVSNRMVQNIQIPMDKIIIDFSKSTSLSFCGIKKRKIHKKRMPSYTNEAKNTMIEESILFFQKK